MKPEILMLAPTRPDTLARLQADYHIHRLDLADDPGALLDRHGAACRAILTHGHKRIDDALLDRLPAVKIVCCSSAGYDAFDLDALARRGIALTNASPALAQEVADTAMVLTMAAWRNLVAADAWVRSGDWAIKGDFPLQRGLRGRRLGVVGMGTIGRQIADLATLLGLQVSYWNRSDKGVPYPHQPDLVQLARDSDILIAIVAGGEGTRHLIDAPVIDALGPQGLLVNVARGSVVDEPALIAALQDGRLGSAGLDVFASEPDPALALTALPNVTLLPHMGSGTTETRAAMARLMADNLDAHMQGRPLISPVTLP